MEIVLPWEDHIVSKNNKRAMWSGGRPAQTSEWTDGLSNIEKAAENQIPEDFEPYDEPVAVTILLWEPTGHHRDISNYTQIIYDGLEGVVYTDDYHINYASVGRAGIDRDIPRAVVYIAPIRGGDLEDAFVG